jgi:subtilase family serine protease
MHCNALVQYRGNQPFVTSAPSGLTPNDIKSVYGFSTSPTAGAGQTIAIVDAYDDRSAEQDLGGFSTQFGLPPCTTLNGCFAKVNQTGGSVPLPRRNNSWGLEISLDVQWAHAIAPGAKILLVEATTASHLDMFAAEDYAKTHANYVSNSWGGTEYIGEQQDDLAHFSQPGVSIFVAAGDESAIPEYPSVSPWVVSVGGTTLHLDTNKALTSETGWDLGGGGCSSYEIATVAQRQYLDAAGTDVCQAFNQIRMTPDLSLDADPNSGVSVYYSKRFERHRGWWTVGGTSASTPMVAARAATTGLVVNSNSIYGDPIAHTPSPMTFRDITSGYNGEFCQVGYDLCSGRGSWVGDTP